MRNVYLDYSATTPVKEEVLKEMLPYFTEKFGNPSSLYDTGLEAKAAVTHAREQVAALIHADPKEVFFTAGGTESDNWALFGACDKLKEKGYRILSEKVAQEVDSYWVNTEEMDIYFGGGTTQRMKIYNGTLVEAPQMATAKGLYIVGTKVFK